MRLIDADDKENIVIVQDDRGMFKRIDAPTIKAVPIEVLREIRAELTKAYVDPYNRNAFRYTTVSLLDVLDLIDNHLKEYEDAE